MSKTTGVPAGKRNGPSTHVVIAITAPTIALLAYLIVWAYRVHDWTWFSLLIAAAVGVSAFVVAPDLFSMAEGPAASDRSAREWCLTMTQSGQGSNVRQPRSDATTATDPNSANAPHKTA